MSIFQYPSNPDVKTEFEPKLILDTRSLTVTINFSDGTSKEISVGEAESLALDMRRFLDESYEKFSDEMNAEKYAAILLELKKKEAKRRNGNYIKSGACAIFIFLVGTLFEGQIGMFLRLTGFVGVIFTGLLFVFTGNVLVGKRSDKK